jgi:hypothetical protein
VFGRGFSSEKNYTQQKGYEKTVEAVSAGLEYEPAGSNSLSDKNEG